MGPLEVGATFKRILSLTTIAWWFDQLPWTSSIVHLH